MGNTLGRGRFRNGRSRAPWIAVLTLSLLSLVGALPIASAGGTAHASVPSLTPIAPTVSAASGPASGGSSPTALARGPPTVTDLVWSNVTGTVVPTARTGASASFDPQLGGLLLFGGRTANGTALADTWQSVGGVWSPRAPMDGRSPPARWGASLAYDSVRGVLLLYGGENSTTVLGDTWAYNATGWRPLSTPVAPSPRAFASASYDPALSGMVLVGGLTAGPSVSNETWLFRSNGWVDLTRALPGAPPPRAWGTATYDPSDGYLLVFGGSDSATDDRPMANPWALGAVGWHNLSNPSAPSPSARLSPGLSYDPESNAIFLFGGGGGTASGPSEFRSDTWSFSAGGWTNLTQAVGPAPPGREGAVLAPSRAVGGLMVFGGDSGGLTSVRADTWRLSAQALSLTLSATPTAGPSPLNVSFGLSISGGLPPYSVTWEFGDGTASHEGAGVAHVYGLPGNFTASVTVSDGASETAVQSMPIAVLTTWQGAHQWSPVGGHGQSAPSPRSGSQVAFDPALQSVILFGGETAGGVPSSETWEFVNNVWIDLSGGLGTAPPGRFGGALTYDTVDATLVLFGGTDGRTALNDTWTFDGSTWTELHPALAPSPRAFAQMTYDPLDGYSVLFGGVAEALGGAAAPVASDTWEYRAGVWVNLTSQLSIAPPPTTGGTFTWDPQDSVLVLDGGSSVGPNGAPGTCYPDGLTWTFVSGRWTSGVSASPTSRVLGMAAYEALDHVVLVYGGAEAQGGVCGVASDSWSYLGGSWSDLSATIPFPPAARDSGAMAFDVAEGVVVLFGGDAGGVLLNDTWIYPSQLNTSATSTTTNSTGSGSNGQGPPPGGTGGVGGSGGTGGNTAPIAPFAVGYSLSSVASTGPLTVTFVATSVGGVAPYAFSWNFGDSTPSQNGSTVSHRYTVSGTFVPVLTASDSRGEIVVAVLASVHVAPNPTSGLGVTPSAGAGGPSIADWSIMGLAVGTAVVVGLAVAFRRQELRQEQGREADELAFE